MLRYQSSSPNESRLIARRRNPTIKAQRLTDEERERLAELAAAIPEDAKPPIPGRTLMDGAGDPAIAELREYARQVTRRLHDEWVAAGCYERSDQEERLFRDVFSIHFYPDSVDAMREAVAKVLADPSRSTRTSRRFAGTHDPAKDREDEQ